MSEQISVSSNNYINNNQINLTQTQKDYIDYESLLPFPSNMNYIQFIKATINTFKKMLPQKTIKEDKQVHHDILHAIENLRIARKYQHKLFENIMNCISERFAEKLRFLENKRIILNALVLISEIFSEYEFKSQKNWIMDLLSLTLIYKFGYINNAEIMEIADVILKRFAKTPAHPETFEVLSDFIQFNSDEEAEVCEMLFKDFVKSVSPQTLCGFNLDYMMKVCARSAASLDNLRLEMLHGCFVGIKEKLNGEQFNAFVSLFKEENKKLFMEIVNLKF